jgi:hypothetical protein
MFHSVKVPDGVIRPILLVLSQNQRFPSEPRQMSLAAAIMPIVYAVKVPPVVSLPIWLPSVK